MTLKLARWRHALVVGSVVVAALLASCGGGDQVEKFAANRVIAFGDELSVIDDTQSPGNGRKYSVNATVSATDQTINCKANPLWIQYVANNFGLVFPQCNPQPNAVAAPRSRIRAAAGARITNLATQIDGQLAESAFTGTDLVTVLAGANDVLDLYALYPGVSRTALLGRAGDLGVTLGQQVNRLAGAGAKVLIATVPDLGYSPFALAEKTAHTDTDRAALMSQITKAMNDRMRATIVNDGRMIGLVLLDDFVVSVSRLENAGSFINVSQPVCDLSKSLLSPPSALDCTTQTLVAGGSGDTYLWSDLLHLSSGGQTALGSLATTRAANNPF